MITRRLTRSVVAGTLVAAGLLFVTAQPAGANWLQMNTPNVPGASLWVFTSVSCTSPRICMAVGSTFGSTDHLLSENRTKKGWTVQRIPQPAAGSELQSVWCTFNFVCIAVGGAPSGKNRSVPLAERWNGSSWRIQKTPKPKGTLSSGLSAVTCASARDCVAVGFGLTSTGEVALVERWNGTSWKIQRTPIRRGFKDSELKGVSCASATRCFAVGDSFSPKSESVILAEVWNGSKWTVQATPNPTGGGILSAVACHSRNACLAVGNGFSARWNGKKWSLVKLGISAGPALLSSISCRAKFCYAGGALFHRGVQTGVIEFWNGSRWHVQNSVIQASNDSNTYNSISCTTSVNCTAVGWYHDPTLSYRALAEDFTLRWHDELPGALGGGVTSAGLNAVSCVSPNSCLAVGFSEDSIGFDAISETWNGTSWTTRAPPPKARTSTLDAVSCKAANFCIAVGDVLRAGAPVSLAERWTGVGWAIQGTPNPAGASGVFLTGVSCAARNACTAVGWYARGSAQLTLAEHWNGHSWKMQHTPNPAHKAFVQLNGISCVSAKACEAVGSSTTGSFAERWDGTSWKVHATPLPKGGRSGSLASVSCASARACIAVGTFSRGGHDTPLSEFWNGKTWTGRAAATPPGGTQSGLTSVSCTSATACGAVGFNDGATTNGFAETWNGRRWGARGIDRPPGSESTDLESVSCNSAIACMAAGSYDDSMTREQMLAVQYS